MITHRTIIRNASLILTGALATMTLGSLTGLAWQDPDAGQPDPDAPAVDQTTETSEIDMREIHVLRVEFQRNAETGRFRILVDGEPVSTPFASSLNRYIRATRGVPFWNIGGETTLEQEEPAGEGRIDPPPADRDLDQERDGREGREGRDGDGLRRDRGDNMFGDRGGRGGFGFGDRNRDDDRDGDDDRRGWWGRPRELDAQTIAELMQVISDVEPDMYQRLIELEALDEERYMDFLKRRSGRYMGLLWIKRFNEDHYALKVREYELNRQTLDLQIQYQQAMDTENTSDAERVKSEILAVVEEHFDNRQAQREYELAGMRSRLEDLERRLKERLESRAEIIGDRMEQLLAKPGLNDF